MNDVVTAIEEASEHLTRARRLLEPHRASVRGLDYLARMLPKDEAYLDAIVRNTRASSTQGRLFA